MVTKFGRNYELKVETSDGGTITITPPFTLEIDCVRNTLSSVNICQVRIYNLSEKNRSRLRFNITDLGSYRQLVLRAGYGSELGQVFTGNVSQCWSVREGTDFITQIECYDGGFAFVNGTTQATFPSGTPQVEVIRSLMGGLPRVGFGAVGNYPGILTRANSYDGNTAEILNDITGGGFYVDSEKAYALQTEEFVSEATGLPSLTINAKSGLLGTPILEESIVRFDMLFEASLNVGRKIKVESLTEKNFNGDYKVIGVKHRGVISDSGGGQLITSGEFLFLKTSAGIISGLN